MDIQPKASRDGFLEGGKRACTTLKSYKIKVRGAGGNGVPRQKKQREKKDLGEDRHERE